MTTRLPSGGRADAAPARHPYPRARRYRDPIPGGKPGDIAEDGQAAEVAGRRTGTGPQNWAAGPWSRAMPAIGPIPAPPVCRMMQEARLSQGYDVLKRLAEGG